MWRGGISIQVLHSIFSLKFSAGGGHLISLTPEPTLKARARRPSVTSIKNGDYCCSTLTHRVPQATVSRSHSCQKMDDDARYVQTNVSRRQDTCGVCRDLGDLRPKRGPRPTPRAVARPPRCKTREGLAKLIGRVLGQLELSENGGGQYVGGRALGAAPVEPSIGAPGPRVGRRRPPRRPPPDSDKKRPRAGGGGARRPPCRQASATPPPAPKKHAGAFRIHTNLHAERSPASEERASRRSRPSSRGSWGRHFHYSSKRTQLN